MPVKKRFTTGSLARFGFAGLEIKKIIRSPFGDQVEKYSRQLQIFSRQFL